jgi:hypothetical protein
MQTQLSSFPQHINLFILGASQSRCVLRNSSKLFTRRRIYSNGWVTEAEMCWRFPCQFTLLQPPLRSCYYWYSLTNWMGVTLQWVLWRSKILKALKQLTRSVLEFPPCSRDWRRSLRYWVSLREPWFGSNAAVSQFVTSSSSTPNHFPCSPSRSDRPHLSPRILPWCWRCDGFDTLLWGDRRGACRSASS